MQSVDTSSIDHLLESWDRLLKDYPNMKRDLLDELGQKILFEVRWGIGPSAKVQYWQDYFIGTKRGYVAIRPKHGIFQVTKNGMRYQVSDITKSIEFGHSHRQPKPTGNKGYHYYPRINVPRVPGLHFYAGAKSSLRNTATPLVQRLAQEIALRLEGGV